MPVDLGNEVPDLPVAVHQFAEQRAARRIDVPFRGDVLDRREHFGLAVITVERDQRRVGAQLPSVRQRAVDAFREPVHEFGAVAALALESVAVAAVPHHQHAQRDEQRAERQQQHRLSVDLKPLQHFATLSSPIRQPD